MINFPSSPILGQTVPVGNKVYAWNGTAWEIPTSPPGGGGGGGGASVTTDDVAPSLPKDGDMWLKTTTGVLYVYYDDGNSKQWVQVSASPQIPGIPDPPNDGGEYVRVNNVWRLKSQTFDLSGLAQKDIPVPAWGPTRGRFTFSIFIGVASYPTMRFSIDGTTFPSGSGDYSNGGFVHFTGTNGFYNIAPNNRSEWLLSNASSNVTVPIIGVTDMTLTRPSNSQQFLYQVRSEGIINDAANGWMTNMIFGSASPTAFPGAGPIKILRWMINTGTALTGSNATMEWLP